MVFAADAIYGSETLLSSGCWKYILPITISYKWKTSAETLEKNVDTLFQVISREQSCGDGIFECVLSTSAFLFLCHHYPWWKKYSCLSYTIDPSFSLGFTKLFLNFISSSTFSFLCHLYLRHIHIFLVFLD